MCQLAQFVIDERHQSFERLLVAGSPFRQECGYQTTRRLRHNSCPAAPWGACPCSTGKFFFSRMTPIALNCTLRGRDRRSEADLLALRTAKTGRNPMGEAHRLSRVYHRFKASQGEAKSPKSLRLNVLGRTIPDFVEAVWRVFFLPDVMLDQ